MRPYQTAASRRGHPMSKAMLKKFWLSFKSRILKGHLARVTKTGQFSKPAGTLDHFLRWRLASTVFGANKKWSILWCRDPVSMLSLLFNRELRASNFEVQKNVHFFITPVICRWQVAGRTRLFQALRHFWRHFRRFCPLASLLAAISTF